MKDDFSRFWWPRFHLCLFSNISPLDQRFLFQGIPKLHIDYSKVSTRLHAEPIGNPRRRPTMRTWYVWCYFWNHGSSWPRKGHFRRPQPSVSGDDGDYLWSLWPLNDERLMPMSADILWNRPLYLRPCNKMFLLGWAWIICKNKHMYIWVKISELMQKIW